MFVDNQLPFFYTAPTIKDGKNIVEFQSFKLDCEIKQQQFAILGTVLYFEMRFRKTEKFCDEEMEKLLA